MSEAVNNFELLKERCQMLRFERFGSSGFCRVHTVNSCGDLFCTDGILVRHGKLDKNGKASAYGQYYCAKRIAEDSMNQKRYNGSWSDSEIEAIRAYYGFDLVFYTKRQYDDINVCSKN